MNRRINHMFCIMIGCMFLQCTIVNAEMISFEGKGEYWMTGQDSVKHAEDWAFKEAVRSISQQAVVAINSKSASVDNQISADEIEMVTATIISVKDKKYDKNIASDGKILVSASVKGELDVAVAEKMVNEIVEAKRIEKDKLKLDKEIMRIKKQYSELKGENPLLAHQLNLEKFYDAIEMERENRREEAFNAYNEIIAEEMNFAPAYSRRGHLYREKGELDLAKKDYDKAATLDNKEAGWYYGMAVLLEKAGKLIEAAKEYRKFIEYSNILEYDIEIPIALQRIRNLEK